MADPDGAPDSFGVLLRGLRHAAELTQEELADRAGVSARAISDLERGRVQVPQRRTAELIAGALDLDSEQQQRFHRAARSGRDSRRLACVGDRPESGAGLVAMPTDPSVQPLAVIIVDLAGCQVDPRLVRAILDTVDAVDGARSLPTVVCLLCASGHGEASGGQVDWLPDGLDWVRELGESAGCGCSRR